MKHVTYADKSLLMGDEVADLLIDYAALLANEGKADRVDVNAISSDGDDVVATFLLGEGAPLMAETSTTKVQEPDNSAASDYLHQSVRTLQEPHPVIPDTPDHYASMDLPS